MLSSTFGIRDKKLRQPALVRENWWLTFEKKDYQAGKTSYTAPSTEGEGLRNFGNVWLLGFPAALS